MKRLLTLALAVLALTAYAEDSTTRTATKTLTNNGKKKTNTTKEKVVRDPPGANNSIVDTGTRTLEQKVSADGTTETTSETTTTHDERGMKNDSRHTSKSRVVRDPTGKVIESESTETK